MNEQFTPELLAKARAAETPEALLALAAENDTTLTLHEAQAYFDQFHQTGELADEELDNVAGGGCKNGGKMVVSALNSCKHYVCTRCGYQKIWGGQHREQGGLDALYCNCSSCKHCTYERGLWLCNNPAAY